MSGWMMAVFAILLFSKIIEYAIGRANEQWLKAQGGLIKGSLHRWLFVLQLCFFISLLLETTAAPKHLPMNLFWLSLTMAALLAKAWCIVSLGTFWNTKNIVIPRVCIMRKGPYKFTKHPEWVIAATELIALPLLFGAYMTSILFILLHGALYLVRLPGQADHQTM